MEPYRDRIGGGIAVPARPVARVVGRLAGLLGRDGDAEAAFATALDVCDRLQAPYWRAQTLADRKRALRQSKRYLEQFT